MNVTTVRSMALSFFIATGVAASPYERTSADLLNDCRVAGASLDTAQSNRCIYYIRGFLDATLLRHRAGADTVVRAPFGSRVARIPVGRSDPGCLPTQIAVDDIIKSLLEFAQNAPDEPTTTAAELLERLLASHFPCARPVRH